MSIKESLRQTFFINAYLKRKRIVSWMKNGYPIPVPHDIKQITLHYYAITHQLDTLVETGTYLGDMVWAQKDYFKKIYSIELSEKLFLKARKRFSGDKHIRIIQGDSSEEIGKVVNEISAPALFWLDGHYSGGVTARGEKICPIYAELEHIFSSPFAHVILVDDARLFTGKDDYPVLEELRRFISDNSDYRMNVENDIIFLCK
jgi:hypothetical protein